MSDLIERQQAIDVVDGYLMNMLKSFGTPNDSEVYAYARGLLVSIDSNIEALPPAQPQRMHGKWEEKNVCDDKNIIEEWQSARCSVCGKYHTTPYMYYFDGYNFCPNCGADMREESNESND